MRPLVYVIMPVGSDPEAESRRASIVAAARVWGLSTWFPLDHRRHGDEVDPSTIRAEMQRATVALADLSLERPSCYFELGVAVGAGLPTIVVAAAGTPIHQTTDRSVVAFYNSLEGLTKILDDRLRRFAYAPSR
jgi:nucleoside 2-deoxyribosyltransferase